VNNPNDSGQFGIYLHYERVRYILYAVGYAFVGRDDTLPGSPVYVMESPQFEIKQNAQLQFDYYIRSVGPRLQVPSAVALPKSHHL
jgi:hypothetical protein